MRRLLKRMRGHYTSARTHKNWILGSCRLQRTPPTRSCTVRIYQVPGIQHDVIPVSYHTVSCSCDTWHVYMHSELSTPHSLSSSGALLNSRQHTLISSSPPRVHPAASHSLFRIDLPAMGIILRVVYLVWFFSVSQQSVTTYILVNVYLVLFL